MKIAILLGAGESKRLKTNVSKQHVIIKNKPLYFWCLETFVKLNLFDFIVLVVQSSKLLEIVNDVRKISKVWVCSGGKTRWDSFINAIDFLNQKIKLKGDDFIMTHDIARALVNKSIILKHFKAYQKGHTVINTVIKASDTITMIDKNLQTFAYPNRNQCYLVQTPQSFTYGKLPNLKNFNLTNYSDLIGLFFDAKIPIFNVIGNDFNFKITFQKDLQMFEFLKIKRN